MPTSFNNYFQGEKSLPVTIVSGIVNGIEEKITALAIDKIFSFAGMGDSGMSDSLNNILSKLQQLQETLDRDFKAMMQKLKEIDAEIAYERLAPLIAANEKAFGPQGIPAIINPDMSTTAETNSDDLMSMLEQAGIGDACNTWHDALTGNGTFNGQGYLYKVNDAISGGILSSMDGGSAKYLEKYWEFLDCHQATTLFLVIVHCRYKSIQNQVNPKDPKTTPGKIDDPKFVANLNYTINEYIDEYKKNRKVQLGLLRGMYYSEDPRPIDGYAAPINHLPPNVIIDKNRKMMWYAVLSNPVYLSLYESWDWERRGGTVSNLNETDKIKLSNFLRDTTGWITPERINTMWFADFQKILDVINDIEKNTGIASGWVIPTGDEFKTFVNSINGQVGVGAGGDFFRGALAGAGFVVGNFENTVWINSWVHDFSMHTTLFIEGKDWWHLPYSYDFPAQIMAFRVISDTELNQYCY